MLTGDKKETAMAISQTAGLTRGNHFVHLECQNEIEAKRALERASNEISALGKSDDKVGRESAKSEKKGDEVELKRMAQANLVIDGESLPHFLEQGLVQDFVNVVSKGDAVVCCRLSPLQKAEIVMAVKTYTKVPSQRAQPAFPSFSFC
jgi:magnesium-transporting ATPase (P-type)